MILKTVFYGIPDLASRIKGRYSTIRVVYWEMVELSRRCVFPGETA